MFDWIPVTAIMHMDDYVLWAIKMGDKIRMCHATLFDLAERDWNEPHEIIGWFPLDVPKLSERGGE